MSKKNVKKASVVISSVMALAISAGIVGGAMHVNVLKAENVKTEFSSEITAVSHRRGETVTIVPEEVKLWNESQSFNPDYLNGLYEYGTLHKEFLGAVHSDNERVAEIYRQADAFNPVNNVLKWESSLDGVASYTVRVAYDKKFTQCVLKVENADANEGVALENPLVGTDYYWQVIATMNSGSKVYSPIFDFTTADTIRTVTIDGVSNTRDLGGYETAYGYVQQGLVYRSARLESISEDGINTLKNELGVKTDLDLRGEVEATTSANRKNPAAMEMYYVYDTPQYALVGDLGIDSPLHYESVKNIMRVFTVKENYPIDVHCAVGRDRTGTICALFKALLGYAENDITNDYFTSMFATTGAWAKETTYTNYLMIMNVMNYLNSFEGATLADKAAAYLIEKCGMEQSEIDAIRDIMTGKIEVENPATETFADVDNYADCAFVTFEKFGTPKVVAVVAKGEKVEMPYVLEEGYEWTVDGVAYDFASAVNGDLTIKGVKRNVYEVTLVCTGDITAEEKVTVAAGEQLDFALLEKSGFSFVVLSNEGKVLSELTVVDNTTLNVIYVADARM